MKKKDGPVNIVQNCHFVGVQYDAKAVEAVVMVADGLREIARAYGALAEVLRASNVQIETLLKMEKPTL